MSDRLFLGAVAPKLEANGYLPTNAAGKRSGPLTADDEPYLLLAPSDSHGFENHQDRRIASLIVVAAEHDKRIDEVLSRFGIGDGPCRVNSAGDHAHVVRVDSTFGEVISRSWTAPDKSDPAVLLIGADRMVNSVPPPANMLRVAAPSWKNGDLLSVRRSELPVLPYDEQDVFTALDAAFGRTRFVPSTKPSGAPNFGTPTSLKPIPNDARGENTIEPRHRMPEARPSGSRRVRF